MAGTFGCGSAHILDDVVGVRPTGALATAVMTPVVRAKCGSFDYAARAS